jgi:hypothetical protein
MERKYTSSHTGDLIMQAIEVTSEVNARLNSIMFALSSIEENVAHLDKDQIVAMLAVLLDQLRGKE